MYVEKSLNVCIGKSITIPNQFVDWKYVERERDRVDWEKKLERLKTIEVKF